MSMAGSFLSAFVLCVERHRNRPTPAPTLIVRGPDEFLRRGLWIGEKPFTGGRGDDDPGDHDRVDEVVGRTAEPTGIVCVGDHLCTRISAAVEVDPPQRGRAREGGDEGADLRAGNAVQVGQGAADDDNRLAKRDQDERLAALGEVAT